MSGSISRRGMPGYDASDEVNPSTEGNEALFQDQFSSSDETFDAEKESRGKEGKQQDEDESLPEDEQESTVRPR